MKCGLIWARRARTSASISAVRESSSCASSSWPETQAATSLAARTRLPVACGAPTTRVPTSTSSTTSGLMTSCRTGQPRRPQAVVSAIRVGAPSGRSAMTRAVSAAWWWPTPSQASTPLVSVSATAGVPSSARRWRRLRSALASVSPSRSAGAASEAVWRVRKVARSASVPRCVRRQGRQPAAHGGQHSPGRALAGTSDNGGCLLEVDQQHVGVGAVRDRSDAPVMHSSPVRLPPRSHLRRSHAGR